jgi:hypothetical protein
MAHSIVRGEPDLCVSYSEKVSYTEFLEVVQSIHNRPAFDQVRSVIHDLRTAEIDPTGANIAYLGAHVLGARRSNPDVKLALVTDHPAMRVLAAAFTQLTKLEVQLFTSLDEAKVWVDRPPTIGP